MGILTAELTGWEFRNFRIWSASVSGFLEVRSSAAQNCHMGNLGPLWRALWASRVLYGAVVDFGDSRVTGISISGAFWVSRRGAALTS